MDRTVRVITVLDWWGSTLDIVLVGYCCLGTSLSRNLKCILNTLLEKVQVGSMWTLKFSNSHIPGLLHTRSEAEGSSCQVIVGLFLEQPSWRKIKMMIAWSEEDMVGTHLTYLEGSTSSRQTSSLPLIWDWWKVVAGDWWTVGGTWFEKMNWKR